MRVYVIRHFFFDELYWNKKQGWVERNNATIFDADEHRTFPLPHIGEWVEGNRAERRRFQNLSLTAPDKLYYYEVGYTVPGIKNTYHFLCKAEDEDHAREQCLDSDPSALIYVMIKKAEVGKD